MRDTYGTGMKQVAHCARKCCNTIDAQLTCHLCFAVSPRLDWADWVCLANRGLPTHAPLVSMEVRLVPIMHSFSSHLQSFVASE